MRQQQELEPQSWEGLMLAIAQHQDRGAFTRVFRHFAPRVKAYAMQGGADAAMAEEIAQETLVTAWRKAALYDPSKAAVSTWLFAIARNLRIDRFRRERRPEPYREEEALTPVREPTPDAVLRQIQSADAVRRAIESLPDEQREAVMLSFYEDEPHHAIAARLNLPLGTVKSRIRLALQKISAQLDEESHGVGK